MYGEAIFHCGEEYEASLFSRLCWSSPQKILGGAQAGNKRRTQTGVPEGSQKKERESAQI
jgi:hypothetical protein